MRVTFDAGRSARHDGRVFTHSRVATVRRRRLRPSNAALGGHSAALGLPGSVLCLACWAGTLPISFRCCCAIIIRRPFGPSRTRCIALALPSAVGCLCHDTRVTQVRFHCGQNCDVTATTPPNRRLQNTCQ